MLVFGMVIKLVPPMFGRRQGLYSLRMAQAQLWLASLGLVGMVILRGAGGPGPLPFGRMTNDQ